jgi:hypothetical protein
MSDEVETLKAEIARLHERIDELECDRAVYLLENECLQRQRADDVKRLAGRRVLE